MFDQIYQTQVSRHKKNHLLAKDHMQCTCWRIIQLKNLQYHMTCWLHFVTLQKKKPAL